MFPFGGAVTFNTPAPIEYDSSTSRWSMSKACVGAPGRTRTTDAMDDASGVVT